MFGDIVIDVVVGVVAFVGGAYVGATHVPTVTNAIAALKAAEQKAKDTIDKITSHKAS